MKRTVLVFGLISGAIISSMLAISIPFHDVLGFDLSEIIGYTSMVAAFLLVYFGVRSYRDNVAGGTVRFGRAFAVGMLIVGVATLCYVVTWEVVYANVGSEFATRYREHTLAEARASGASAAEIERKSAEQQRFWEMYRNPAVRAALTFIEPMPVGLIIALVSAGLLSRKRSPSQGSVPAHSIAS